jgi:hypothetical protein
MMFTLLWVLFGCVFCGMILMNYMPIKNKDACREKLLLLLGALGWGLVLYVLIIGRI